MRTLTFFLSRYERQKGCRARALIFRADEFPVASNKREIQARASFVRDDARAPCESVGGACSSLPTDEVILMRISTGLYLLQTRVQESICRKARRAGRSPCVCV